MKEDKILKMFFEGKRWKYALDKGHLKDIDPKVLRFYASPAGRTALLAMVASGQYEIERPHTAKIPKDTPGEFREVFINRDPDRVFLSILNDLLFEICGDMVHPSCTSYQKGIGCARIVTKASAMIEELSGTKHKDIGWKADLSKYFDSVPIQFIDRAFDMVEKRYGKSVIIDIVRKYYHNNKYYDSEKKCEAEKYQSLKQGCAVAAWLADVMLYDIDKKLSEMDGYYVRYSDDTLFIGKDYKKAMKVMSEELKGMKMTLNPKKVEAINNNKWFKFLGYSIKGKNISLSKNRIHTFVNEVRNRTVKKIRTGITYKQAARSVQSWLYYGDGEHSWAQGVLKTINVKEDVDTLNNFVMDCLRAVQVGKPVKPADIGGLGWVKIQVTGCISRGKGSKVKTLKTKTPQKLEGYFSLGCMRNNLLYGKDLYEAIVRDLL